jgi:hypothetical protein
MHIFYILLISILPFAIMSFFQRKNQKKQWNNGACFCNKGWMQPVAMDSGGAIAYKCTECTRFIWLDYFKP